MRLDWPLRSGDVQKNFLIENKRIMVSLLWQTDFKTGGRRNKEKRIRINRYITGN